MLVVEVLLAISTRYAVKPRSRSASNIAARRLYNDLKRRHDLCMKGGSSRFLKVDIKKLAYFKDKSRRATLHFEVFIVQPGASVASINEDALKLLATIETYLLKIAAAGFRVIVSE